MLGNSHQRQPLGRITCKMIPIVQTKEEVEKMEKMEEKIFKRILSQSFARNEKLTSYLSLTIKSWKDVALSETFISAITNDGPMIKQALFPSPGSNVSGSKGGGKPKMDFHWQLCQILFTDHKTYGPALHKAEGCTVVKKWAALKRTWGIKIKNRLKK